MEREGGKGEEIGWDIYTKRRGVRYLASNKHVFAMDEISVSPRLSSFLRENFKAMTVDFF